MNGLKNTIYNCREATFLIEKKQLVPLTMRETLKLKIHLTGCSFCRLFQKQSIVINSAVHRLFSASVQQELKLDERFKNDMQSRIEEELNKD